LGTWGPNIFGGVVDINIAYGMFTLVLCIGFQGGFMFFWYSLP